VVKCRKAVAGDTTTPTTTTSIMLVYDTRIAGLPRLRNLFLFALLFPLGFKGGDTESKVVNAFFNFLNIIFISIITGVIKVALNLVINAIVGEEVAEIIVIQDAEIIIIRVEVRLGDVVIILRHLIDPINHRRNLVMSEAREPEAELVSDI